MNILDIIIVVLLITGGLIGFKRGFIQSLVIFLGTILVFYLSFKFKSPLAEMLYKNFPFFDFDGLRSMNLLFYEGLSFIILLIVLFIVLKILIMVSGIIETMLKWTVILAIPSKILGIIVGMLHFYVIIYIALLILSFPMFNIKSIKESKGREIMLNYTPLLSKVTNKTISTLDKVFDIKSEDINTDLDKENMDKQILEIINESGIIAKDNIKELINEGKLKEE